MKDMTLRTELDLLRAFARQRRAESLKLTLRRMMAASRPVNADAAATTSALAPAMRRDAA